MRRAFGGSVWQAWRICNNSGMVDIQEEVVNETPLLFALSTLRVEKK
jgi:hypothetical protein